MKGKSGKTAPDCATCVRRETCERAREGTFCPMWAANPPRDRGESPADKWARGDENEL